MCAYLQGHVAGAELEKTVAKYEVAAKSHMRIGVNE